MHGAGEQQQQQNGQQNHRYRLAIRMDEQQQPTTSSRQHPRHANPSSLQTSMMCTPTSATTTISGNTGGQRFQPKRNGDPIKLGNLVLEPAGTLVFQDKHGIPSGNKKAVVANLFSIGPSPVLTLPPPVQRQNGNWYTISQNQPSTSSASNVISLVPLSNNHPPATSSATPDSGIQSVPTSPPSPTCEFHNDRKSETVKQEQKEQEEDDDLEDFADMPTLKPVDEEDYEYDLPSTSSGPCLTDINKTVPNPVHSTTSTPLSTQEDLANGMNAQEILSFAPNMDEAEIVRRILAFAPEKADSIATLIKKGSAEEAKKKKKDMEAEVSSTTPTTPRVRGSRRKSTFAGRSTNSPDVTTSNLPPEPSTSSMSEEIDEAEKAEGKRRGRKPKRKRVIPRDESKDVEVDIKKAKCEQQEHPEASDTVETTSPSRPESAASTTVDPVQFRLKIREMMERQLEQLTQKMSDDMTELRLGHSTSLKIGVGKRKESFLRQLNEQSRKLRKSGVPTAKRMRMFATDLKDGVEEGSSDAKKEGKEGIPFKMRSRIPSRRLNAEETPEYSNVEEKFNGEYNEITRSVPWSEDIVSIWKAPSLACGCTKGACTSDMECLNRALRVQCSKECTLSYCSNRRFWKEDCDQKLRVSNRSKDTIKTKTARRAGEFLCEYAGEVITYEEARSRFIKNHDARIIAIGPQLFVDATNRGNLARFIKHSCTPNTRVEIWSVNGSYKAGIFCLADLSSNVEITMDKSGLLPFDISCNCSSPNCKKIVRGMRRAIIASAEDKNTIETRRFLQRNRRKTIRSSRKFGIPSILLSTDDKSSILLQMKKTLAAFSYRARAIGGSIPLSMLSFYSSIKKWLEVNSSNPDPAEFISLLHKWIDAAGDEDLERSFIAIESHYLPSSLLSSAQQPKKSIDNASKAKTASTSCVSPVPSKRGDADLSYLESEYPIGSYDPDDAWETYQAKSRDNAVRCTCGALDEDGEMVQCDKCHFWLHIDCCQYSIKEEKDYICEFCSKTGEDRLKRPVADIKLLQQPEVRFENCVYYRSLMNRRGIQVRLNETVYVNRVFPDDHKVMLRSLREEKKGAKHKEPNKYRFPEAPTEKLVTMNVERKDARIFRVERLFVCPGNNRFVFGSFYAWPHETFADTGKVFSKREVFATSYYETLPLDEVIGRCLVVDVPTWIKGRPKVPKFKEEDVYHCDMQIGKNQRVFEKVPPKNRYPINTQPYVFEEFTTPKKVVKDFRPYDSSNHSPKTAKAAVTSNSSSTTVSSKTTSSESLRDVNMKRISEKKIEKVLSRLVFLNSKQT
ncbi:hypothetical protein B9Z55_001885 [Caenorhabditis nigoni]|uniref:SET domain-containing protein n=1 Tax=Caenorhabditis nigoni TaxID=1611254 RepID=A0A2G5VHV6_9PELO|nr:hypothetical protein B9Z55_001885 [Caenorhabditis nigoni]